MSHAHLTLLLGRIARRREHSTTARKGGCAPSRYTSSLLVPPHCSRDCTSKHVRFDLSGKRQVPPAVTPHQRNGNPGLQPGFATLATLATRLRSQGYHTGHVAYSARQLARQPVNRMRRPRLLLTAPQPNPHALQQDAFIRPPEPQCGACMPQRCPNSKAQRPSARPPGGRHPRHTHAAIAMQPAIAT